MAPSTPVRKPLNKHISHAANGNGMPMDTPLGDLSNAFRDTKPTGGDKGKMAASKQKGRLDSIPAAATEVRITRDWEGPEAKVSRPKLATVPSVSPRSLGGTQSRQASD